MAEAPPLPPPDQHLDESSLECPPCLVWTAAGDVVTIQPFAIGLRKTPSQDGREYQCSVQLSGNWLCAGLLGRHNEESGDEILHLRPYRLSLSHSAPMVVPATTFTILREVQIPGTDSCDSERDCARLSERDLATKKRSLFFLLRGTKAKEVVVLVSSDDGISAQLRIPLRAKSTLRSTPHRAGRDEDTAVENVSSDSESAGTEFEPEEREVVRKPKPTDISKVGIPKPPSVPTAVKGKGGSSSSSGSSSGSSSSPRFPPAELRPASSPNLPAAVRPPCPPRLSLHPACEPVEEAFADLRAARERAQAVVEQRVKERTSPPPPPKPPTPPAVLPPTVPPPTPLTLLPPPTPLPQASVPPTPLPQASVPPTPLPDTTAATCTECSAHPCVVPTLLCYVCTTTAAFRRLKELRQTSTSLREQKRKLDEQCVSLSAILGERLSKRTRYLERTVREDTLQVSELGAQVTFLEAELRQLGEDDE
jgi:hypothetical protein